MTNVRTHITGAAPTLRSRATKHPGAAPPLMVIAAVFASVLIVTFSGVQIVFPLLVVAVLAIVLRMRVGTFATPAMIPLFLLPTLATAGYYANGATSLRGGVSYFTQFDNTTNLKTFDLICGAAIAMGLSAAIFAHAPRNSQNQRKTSLTIMLSRPTISWLIFVSALPAFFTVVGVGFRPLFSRSHYLTGASGGVFSLASGLGFASVVVLGFILAQGSDTQKRFAFVGSLIYLLLFFALGTRKMALWPAILMAGFALGRKSRAASFAFVASLVLSVWLLRVPLILRAQSSHGIIPYAHDLRFAFTTALPGNPVLNNLIAGYPVTGTTAYLRLRLPTNWIWIELNPAPGRVAGWYEIRGYLKLNAATPMGAIGEAGNRGAAYVGIIFFGIGAYLAYLDSRIRAFANAHRQIVSVAYFGFVALFAVQILQYPLRTSIRPLYYLLALDILIRVFPRLVGLTYHQDLTQSRASWHVR